MLPEILYYSELLKLSQNDEKKIGIAMDTEDVEVQYLNMNIPVHLIIGASQTGKTNLLKLAYKQCEAEKVFISDSRGYDFQEFEHEENIVYVNSEAQIEAYIQQLSQVLEQRKEMFAENGTGMRPKDFYATVPAILMLIDDVDRFIEYCKPVASQMENLIIQAIECGFCIVATTLPSRLRGYDNITKTLKDTQNAIILGNPTEQSIFVFQPPRGYRQQVDMGFMYSRDSSKMIKIPLAQ